MTDKPRYSHDCGRCQFRGRYGTFDVYVCARCDGGTWIARYGDDGAEYTSYPVFVLDQIFRGDEPDEALTAIRAARATCNHSGRKTIAAKETAYDHDDSAHKCSTA